MDCSLEQMEEQRRGGEGGTDIPKCEAGVGGALLSSLEELPAESILDIRLAESDPLPPEDVRDLDRLLPAKASSTSQPFSASSAPSAAAEPSTPRSSASASTACNPSKPQRWSSTPMRKPSAVLSPDQLHASLLLHKDHLT